MDISAIIQGGRDGLASSSRTHHVIADVGDAVRFFVGGEQCIEAGNPEGLRRWHGEPLGKVVDGTLRDPSDFVLDRVERRKQHAARPLGSAQAPEHHPVVPDLNAHVGEDGIDCISLSGCGASGRQVEVHALSGHRFDAHGGRLELGGARLRIPGVQRQDVHIGFIGVVDRHESKP